MDCIEFYAISAKFQSFNGGYSNDQQERVYQNCKLYDPGVLVLGRGHISYIMRMHYFFKNFLFYSKAYSDKLSTVYIVMMT